MSANNRPLYDINRYMKTLKKKLSWIDNSKKRKEKTTKMKIIKFAHINNFS